MGNELQNKEFSDGSGIELYDFNARTYDQQIGRFIQVDPLSEEEDQEGWSPYHYSYNNPVTYSDPDGKFPFPIIWVIAAWLSSEAVVTTTVVTTTALVTTAAVHDMAADENAKPLPVKNSSIPWDPSYIDKSRQGVYTDYGKSVQANSTLGEAGKGIVYSTSNGGASKVGNGAGKYTHLKEPKTVGPGRKTTPAQRKRILEENKKQNDGILKDDVDGSTLNPPKRNVKGQKADMDQAEVDHKRSRANKGSNSNSNLQVRSKRNNLKKGTKDE